MTSSVFLTQTFCQVWHYTETEDFVSLAEDIECDCMADCRKKITTDKISVHAEAIMIMIPDDKDK